MKKDLFYITTSDNYYNHKPLQTRTDIVYRHPRKLKVEYDVSLPETDEERYDRAMLIV
jgi:hypothetical protein